MKKLKLFLAIFVLSLTSVFASHDSPILLSGTTITGINYIVYHSEEIYHFNGNVYDIYMIDYEGLENAKLAVLDKSYIVLGENFTIFYESTRNGFGVRKIFFQNPLIKEKFNSEEYQKQTILNDNKRIGTKNAIGLVVSYFPKLIN